MRRYVLFAGSTYYPKGGWKDRQLDALDPTFLRYWYNSNRASNGWDWGHILDTQTGKIVEPDREDGDFTLS